MAYPGSVIYRLLQRAPGTMPKHIASLSYLANRPPTQYIPPFNCTASFKCTKLITSTLCTHLLRCLLPPACSLHSARPRYSDLLAFPWRLNPASPAAHTIPITLTGGPGVSQGGAPGREGLAGQGRDPRLPQGVEALQLQARRGGNVGHCRATAAVWHPEV